MSLPPLANASTPPSRGVAPAAAAHRPTRRRRWLHVAAALGIAVALALGLAERAGWPFLAQPLAQWLSARLDREVRFGPPDAPGFALHLWGGIRLQADELQVANPAWSSMGPMLHARQAELRLRYRDLLQHRDGEALKLAQVQADTLDLQVERLADGRASWQLGLSALDQAAEPRATPAVDGVRVGRLAVRAGTWQVRDAQLVLALNGDFRVDDGPDRLPAAAAPAPSAAPAASTHAAAPAEGLSSLTGLSANGQGRYLGQPLKLSVRTGSTAAWWDGDAHAESVALQLHVDSGPSQLRFDGAVADPMGEPRLTGRYTLRGPSLADLGRPLRITLPSTRAVSLQGRLSHQGTLWHTVVDRATIGRSQLAASLQVRRTPGRTPQLDGRVTGTVLWLEDLGPAIGVPLPGQPRTATGGRVLPDRPFDLPSLRAMDAHVLVALDRLESGSARLKAVAPLSAQITLQDAVLDITEIDARLAQGRVRGHAQLDGRKAVAVWRTELQAQGLDLADWISQARSPGLPPYVTGRLAARVQLTGQGRSTAQILASAQGKLALQWTRGRISHLVVEAAGIDLAQALGVYLKGDDGLPVTCGAADLVVTAGVARPRVLLVDTRDSTLWAEGSVSLVDERLDLQVHVSPKDKSPLSLRTPIQLSGSFSAPQLSLDKTGLARRLVPAALLALVNPLAGLLPLLDLGDADAPADAIKACQAVVARHLPAPRM